MKRNGKAQSLPHRAAIYVRVSKPEQAKATDVSMPTQKTGCENWAITNGYPPVIDEYVYSDTHTGEELYERPGLTRLREAAKAHEFDTVIVWTVDRLGRDPIHQGIVIMELERVGVKVEFANDDIDDSAEGQLIRFIKGYAAKIENATRVERGFRAKRELARRGRPLIGPRPPYGYEWNADKTALLIEPVKAAIVRRMFQEVANGKPLRQIAYDLTTEGIPTPTGRSQRWDQSVIQVMLQSPTYWGKHVAFRTKKEKYTPEERATYKTRARRVWADDSENVLIPPEIVPPIVDEPIAKAVNERIRMNKILSTRNTRNPEQTLLQGSFLKCGYCGGGLMVMRNTNKDTGKVKTLYTCRQAARVRHSCVYFGILAHIIEGMVWKKITEILTHPDIIVQEVDRIKETGDPGKSAIEAIDEQLARIERMIANLTHVAALTEDPDAVMHLAQTMSAHSKQKRELEEERKSALAHYAHEQEQKNSLNALLDWCTTVGQNLESLDHNQKRAVFMALGLQVKVYRTDHDPRVEMFLNLPFSGMIAIAQGDDFVLGTPQGS